MPRTFFCDGIRGIAQHRWTVEDSPLKLDHKNLFIQCPDHDDLPKNEGPYADPVELERIVEAIRSVDSRS